MASAGVAAGSFRAWRRAGALFATDRPNNFDLIRLVAATLVLVDHSFVLTGREGRPGPFGYETLGGFAVAVFFIVSGFLVAGSWERAPRPWSFLAKRALRIIPAYAVVVVACALAFGPWWTDLTLGQYFRHPQTWTFLGNLSLVELYYSLPGVFAGNPFPTVVNGSIWTLPIEAAAYLLLTALGCLGLMTRAGVMAVVATLAVVWLGWGSALSAAPPLFLEVFPAFYTVHLALWFFIGSAFWVWRDRIRYRSDAAAALLVLLWASQGTWVGSALLHAALPYLVLWGAQLGVRWMNRFGQHGDFSYGLYLYAFPVQQTLTALGGALWPQPVYIAASFGGALLFAVASWRLVERRALRLKRRSMIPAMAIRPKPA